MNESVDRKKLRESIEKESMVDVNLHSHGNDKKDNFKSKLSKFKCLESGGQNKV